MSTATFKVAGNSSYRGLAPLQWLAVVFACGIISLASVNQYQTFAALMLVPFLYTLLWRNSEPPVVLLAVGVQWLQASTRIFDANFKNLEIDELSGIWTAGDAIWLCLIGVLVLALGVRLAWYNMPTTDPDRVQEEIDVLSPKRLFYLYLIVLVIVAVVNEVMWRIPRLSQFLFHLVAVKWVVFYALVLFVFSKREGYSFMLLAVGFEIVVGVTGFFAEYQTVFFVTILALLTRVQRISISKIIALSTCVLLLVYLGIIWSAIKSDYRDFVNLGLKDQSVRVPVEERLNKIVDLSLEMDAAGHEKGVESLVSRVGYTEYFSHVLVNVPDLLPHEGGVLWSNALSHVLMPRLLFPDKKAIALDTHLTEKYTGIYLLEQGGMHTNVPLGYMVESYIDFGIVFMYLPIFLVGMGWGIVYRLLISQPCSALLKFGVVSAALLQAMHLEMPAPKLLGGMIMSLIVMIFACRFLIPHFEKYLGLSFEK